MAVRFHRSGWSFPTGDHESGAASQSGDEPVCQGILAGVTRSEKPETSEKRRSPFPKVPTIARVSPRAFPARLRINFQGDPCHESSCRRSEPAAARHQVRAAGATRFPAGFATGLRASCDRTPPGLPPADYRGRDLPAVVEVQLPGRGWSRFQLDFPDVGGPPEHSLLALRVKRGIHGKISCQQRRSLPPPATRSSCERDPSAAGATCPGSNSSMAPGPTTVVATSLP